MKIKTIERTMSFGEYENISFCAHVEQGEDPESVLQRLEKRMKRIIGVKEDKNHLSADIEVLKVKRDELKQEKERLQEDIARLSDKRQELMEWCKQHKIDVDSIEELPF